MNDSIVAVDRFIQATRDSGYKSTTSALAEIVDNSLQAGATSVRVLVDDEGDGVEIDVLDDGTGMTSSELRQALRFGGSSRFGDRGGLGRFGMGLPNSSLSQARRVEVFTWRAKNKAVSSYLDVDEVAGGKLKVVPKPRRAAFPLTDYPSRSGTLVRWKRCDRLDNVRVSTIERKTAAELGRKFRYFLWSGVELFVNDQKVAPIDPLFLHKRSIVSGAELFGTELEYEVVTDPSDSRSSTSLVRIRFSELPVKSWARLPLKEKRRLGISKGAGVSVVRAGREIDHGWFFMGGKRRENYDDWWRCEVQFDPQLDEMFGVTHTKQQVKPHRSLIEAISRDIEETARVLNSRARRAHSDVKSDKTAVDAEQVAMKRESKLAPLRSVKTRSARVRELRKQHPVLTEQRSGAVDFRFIERDEDSGPFFGVDQDGAQLIVSINRKHAFYRTVYKKISRDPSNVELRKQLNLLLLSAARAERSLKGNNREAFRVAWSRVLSAYLDA